MLLKARQGFGQLTTPMRLDPVDRTKSFYRYQTAIRRHLSVTPLGDAAEGLVAEATFESTETMGDPADLINRAGEALQAVSIDFPRFSTFDRLESGSSCADLHSGRGTRHGRTCGGAGRPAGQANQQRDD